MRRFQIILLLLVVIPLVGLTFASISLFNSEVENLHLQKRAAVVREFDHLNLQMREHGTDIGTRAIGIVRAAYDKGIWQLRCLHLEPQCAVDPDDLVRFGVVFNPSTTRIYPPQRALEQTFVEKRMWARLAPRINELAAELRNGKPDDERQSGGGGRVFSNLVKTIDGPAVCTFSGGQSGKPGARAIYCAVMDQRVFQRAVINILTNVHGDLRNDETATHLEISGAGDKVMWSSKSNLSRGDKLHEGVLDWPFDGLKISGTWLSGDPSFFSLPVLGLMTIILPGSLVLIGLAFFLYQQRIAELRLAGKQVERAALISHELRTPLTNIRIYLEMIRGNLSGEREMETHCQTIVSEIERLDSLIERTLYSVQNGGQEIQLNSAIRPDDVITTICARFGPLIEEGSAKVALDLNATHRVNIDRWDFEQVLINLLDNARKHAPGSHISVSSKIEDDILLIEVIDDESSTRLLARKLDGINCMDGREDVGFGLGICREIVGTYRGELVAQQHAHGRRYIASFRVNGHVGEGGAVCE